MSSDILALGLRNMVSCLCLILALSVDKITDSSGSPCNSVRGPVPLQLGLNSQVGQIFTYF